MLLADFNNRQCLIKYDLTLAIKSPGKFSKIQNHRNRGPFLTIDF